jgi:peptide/nickel transport system substrate-binding protein
MTMGSLLKIEEGVLLRDQWEARGEGKIMTPPDQVRVAEIQFRDPSAPFARDVQARRALFHALDRPLMVSTLHYGLTKVANSYVSPEDAGWSAVEDAIAKYPYDRAQALQLFAAAGWDRGADGTLANAAGERFQVNARTLDSPQYVKEAQVVVDQWRDVGVAAEIETYGRARQNDSEYRAKFQGVAFGSPSPDAASMLRWSSRELATEANGWKGQNRNAYVRPEVDQLLTRYFATIEPGPRNETLEQLFKFIADDHPALTLYYPVRVFAIRKGLAGVVPEKPGDGWEGFNAQQIHWE